jgi:serine/threonine-protein kinase
MAADPELRYASASAMARELRRWLERHSRTRSERPEARERAEPARAIAVVPDLPGDSPPDGRAGPAQLWRRSGSGAPVTRSAAERSPAPRTGARALAIAVAGMLMLLAGAVGLAALDRSGANDAAPGVAAPAATAPIADTSGDASAAPDAAASASRAMAADDGSAAPTSESAASALPAAPATTPAAVAAAVPTSPADRAIAADAGPAQDASAAAGAATGRALPTGSTPATRQATSAGSGRTARPTSSTTTPAQRLRATAPNGSHEASAAAAGSGTLQFAISPWGEVEVNGQRVGTTPPLARLALPAGTHHIVVRNADFQPYAATVQLQADQPVTVRHRFGP